MTGQFKVLAEKFHEHSWSSEGLQFKEALTVVEWMNSQHLALVGDMKGTLHSVDTATTGISLTDRLSVGSSRVSDVSISPGGDVFACVSAANPHLTIGSLERDNGTFEQTTSALKWKYQPLSVSFMQDYINGQSLILIGSSRGIGMVDAHSGAVFREFDLKGGVCTMCSWSGCMVMAGGSDGSVALCDVRTRDTVAHFESNVKGRRTAYSVDSTSRVLAMGQNKGQLRLFDMSSRKMICQKKVADEDVKAVAFSPQMRFLLAADKTKLSIIDLNEIVVSSEPFRSKEVDMVETVTGIKWNPKGCSFLTRSTDRKLRTYRLEDID